MNQKIDPATTGNETESRQLELQLVYIKDLSFEAPNGPLAIQETSGEPEVALSINNSVDALSDDRWEVTQHISVHARLKDKTVFLVELDQAGLFKIGGYEDDDRKRLLGIFCPQSLFPYAREIISSTVSKGGFPPLILQPVNFEALYARNAAKQGQGAQT